MSDRWGFFAEARKAWYHTNASGLLPLDATYTSFAEWTANAELDPLTFQVGLTPGLAGWRRSGELRSAPTRRKWTLRGGLTSLRLADKIDLWSAVRPFPARACRPSSIDRLAAGRHFLTPNIAINATLGFPPTIEHLWGGHIGALPKLGKVTYGPTVLTVQCHPTRSGRIRPYVGVGASYMIVFDTKDGAFEDLEVDNDLALAFEAGTEIMINSRWAIFADVKKALLRPRTYGSFGGAAVVGDTRLDPWAFSGGVAFHF